MRKALIITAMAAMALSVSAAKVKVKKVAEPVEQMPTWTEWHDLQVNEVNRYGLRTNFFAYENEQAALAGNKLTLNLGYSHAIEYIVPEGVKLTVTDGVKIVVAGPDKQLVGEVAARIRRYKKPEPYKGKGVRYSDEHVVIKPGKTNA